MLRASTFAVSLVAGLVLPGVAHADEKSGEVAVEATGTTTANTTGNTTADKTKNDEAERSHAITLRLGGIGYGTYPPHGVATNGGLGGGIVVSLATHLDVEASAFFVSSSDDERLPMQLVVRRPFYVSRVVRPYVGAGARMSHVFGPASTNLFGFVTNYGTYLWFADHLGAYAELNAAAAFSGGKAIPEVGATAGLSLGF